MMIPRLNCIASRMGCRSGSSSVRFPGRRFTTQHFHGLQRCHVTQNLAIVSKMFYPVQYFQKPTTRRLLSAGATKKTKGTPKSIKRVGESERNDSTSKLPQRSFSEFWKSYSKPKPMPDRWSAAWYQEMALICTVFAITGSSTMILVRPAVSKGLGLQGTFKDGPWSFRICSLVVMTPIYGTLLLVVGTVFGRHAYFRHFSVKMWSRFGIPPEMIDKSWHETKKNFRKW
mmetsp:Transcript_13023/g.30703  ORF Transcript_13023/g.30703 Transcript_13023/m.30703 type:complete len:229 (+) Transcript_13023:129-815(+)